MSLIASILFKVTITLLLALVAIRLARKSRSAVRHVLLTATFAVLAILPVASFVAPSISVAVPRAVREAIVSWDVTDEVADRESSLRTATVAAVGPPAGSRWSWPSLLSLLVAGWLAGVALLLFRVIAGLRQVRALRSSGLPWRDGQAMADSLAAEVHIHRRIEVMLHEGVPGPVTFGVRHPAIVLPIDAHTWAREDLHRALVHELEHVRRGDWVSRCLARVVAACYWFHPMVWVAWRQLVLEAERACDDAVLSESEATTYADQLVLLAQRLSEASHEPQLAMASRSDLAARVVAVLDSRQRRGRAGATSIALAYVVAALLVAAMSPLHLGASTFAADAAPVFAAQAAAADKTAARQKFDVATIKRCETEETPTGARGTAGGTNATFSPGRFYVPCVTTEQLIYLAYAAYGVGPNEHLVNDNPGAASNETKVRGGPAWVHSPREKYSIEATAAGATERTVLMGAMLRSLLEDRFGLKIHRDTEVVAMYALRVAKGGFKLKPMKEGDCDPDAPAMFDPNALKPKCGNLNMMGIEGGKTRWTFGGFDLSNVAGRLSSVLRTHVIDETNIKDKFIIRFEFVRDPDPLVTESSIFAAVEEQLGLKLETTKGPRGFLVIDAIERPSPDGPAPSRARASQGLQ